MMRRCVAGSLLSVGLMTVGSLAFAQAAGEIQTIWRCVDASGKTHVTNVKEETTGRDCKVIQSQRVTVMPALPKPAAKSPAGFPKESAGDRSSARDRQRAALESELSSEEALLAKAKAELA